MDFVDGVVDFGAKEINVSGVASVEPISKGQVRITYYVLRNGERSAAVHLVWDREEWLASWRLWDQARGQIDMERDMEASRHLRQGTH